MKPCEGKAQFLTRAAALRAAGRRKGRMVYRCKDCPYWHVGTSDLGMGKERYGWGRRRRELARKKRETWR